MLHLRNKTSRHPKQTDISILNPYRHFCLPQNSKQLSGPPGFSHLVLHFFHQTPVLPSKRNKQLFTLPCLALSPAATHPLHLTKLIGPPSASLRQRLLRGRAAPSRHSAKDEKRRRGVDEGGKWGLSLILFFLFLKIFFVSNNKKQIHFLGKLW